jgi:transcriptional regulator with XRE-family HTH domain
MQLIENITHIMAQKNITAYQLEKDTGIKQSTFWNWKNGTQPAGDKLQTIISYLGVSPNEIFGYENIELNENEKELLSIFKQLPEREQIKFIGKAEDYLEKYKEK